MCWARLPKCSVMSPIRKVGSMKKIGVMNHLEVLRFTSVGAYLNDVDESSETDVLLPTKYVPDTLQIGDFLDVFLYRDSEDRLIATTQTPMLMKGQMGLLSVADVHQVGAFLSWGLEKDLFLPYKEQTRPLKIGEQLLVLVYEDISERLCATMKVSNKLATNHSFNVDTWTEGFVYQINPQIGAFVAVEGKFHGLVPIKEWIKPLKEGMHLKVRIQTIKPDGKLDLSLRERVGKQIHSDVDVVLAELEKRGGSMPYWDGTDPEVITKVFGMSKRAFKRSCGVLLKQDTITMDATGIKKKDK